MTDDNQPSGLLALVDRYAAAYGALHYDADIPHDDPTAAGLRASIVKELAHRAGYVAMLETDFDRTRKGLEHGVYYVSRDGTAYRLDHADGTAQARTLVQRDNGEERVARALLDLAKYRIDQARHLNAQAGCRPTTVDNPRSLP